MAVALLRKSTAARVAWTAAFLHLPETHLLADHASSAALGSVIASSHREGGFHWARGLISSRRFHADSLGVQPSERNGNNGEGSVPAQPLQPSFSVDDFRSLVVRKKSEVAILEAALEILETAPRDKRFEDLVRKHNIQFEPVLGHRVAVEPSSQIKDSFNLKNDAVGDNSLGFESGRTSSFSQQDRSWNVEKPVSPKTDSSRMFGKLSLDDFPPPVDPNFERLQKKRRRQELLKEYERNNKIESLNFGVAGKSAAGGSNPIKDRPVDPSKPNALPSTDQPPAEKTYKSLADRLYEEQFGHPAPPGLKRTYPKGSFYDRCMKEKEQREREAAAASAAVRTTSTGVSVSSNNTEAGNNNNSDNSTTSKSNGTSSNGDLNQERKPGAWKCPECTFFNLAADKYCYRCQAQRGENGSVDQGRDSRRQSSAERERA